MTYTALITVLVAAALFILRAVYLILQIFTTNCNLQKNAALRTIICIGSGGHTAEMLCITKSLDVHKFQPRLYILADNDDSSEIKIHKSAEGIKYDMKRIPRSRNVKQSYITSVFSTLYSSLLTIPVVLTFQPDVILCNGPGTCVPICIVGFILRCLFILDCRIIFIESICRVRTLSLSGKILQYFADIIVVQWPPLKDVCFRAKYFGRLT